MSANTTVSARPARAKKISEWEMIERMPAVQEAMKSLPSNYDFEIPKTLWKILSIQAKTVVLQFPEGLLIFSCIISDILHRFTGAEVVILSEVTYGACCVDDYAALHIQADLLVHYGHSCLVPVQDTKVKTLYVFVGIRFNVNHLVETVKSNFEPGCRLALLGTVQFLSAINEAHSLLRSQYAVSIPQVKPLSKGETLGCTAPYIRDADALIFVADGRFHMEAAMIRNPTVPAYKYDPYSKKMTREEYDQDRMLGNRRNAIEKARQCTKFGLILGTLGHQGSVAIVQRLESLLSSKAKTHTVFLMSEVQGAVLREIDDVEAWIQVSCPRLSIDWGVEFTKPLLTPYEAMVALEGAAWQERDYPMDYYANEQKPWANYF